MKREGERAMDKILNTEITEPVLTFEPFPEEEKKELKVEEKAEISAVKKEMENLRLTEAEKKMVADFSSKIDLKNTNLVLQYGSGAQKKIADFSESALDNVRSKDLGEIGNLLSGVLAISGGRQLPFDDNITFEEKLKEQFGNVGTGLAVCYVENGNRDHELDMKYINLTNNNYSYIKTIYDDNEQSILECFFMPKIRLLNNEGKESMNSNKSETLWKIYLRSCYNIQSNFLDFMKTFNKLYFGKYVKIDIALPTFEDETTIVIQNVEKLMNLGLMNRKQAIEYINQQNSDFKLEYDESLMNESYDITSENQW